VLIVSMQMITLRQLLLLLTQPAAGSPPATAPA
jgi:hypothetical protein